MTDQEIFAEKTDKFTEIYDAYGGLIDRKNGHVYVDPKDYDEFMPIEYRHIVIITKVENVISIEK